MYGDTSTDGEGEEDVYGDTSTDGEGEEDVYGDTSTDDMRRRRCVWRYKY